MVDAYQTANGTLTLLYYASYACGATMVRMASGSTTHSPLSQTKLAPTLTQLQAELAALSAELTAVRAERDQLRAALPDLLAGQVQLRAQLVEAQATTEML